MKKFPKFWFEGNLYFNWVNSEEDLEKVYKVYEGCMTRNEILDKSKNEKNHEAGHNYANFGLRREHHDGNKTLREFLEENGVLLHKEFIPVLFPYHTHAEIVREMDPSEIVYRETNVVKLLKLAIEETTKFAFNLCAQKTEPERINLLLSTDELVQMALDNFIAIHSDEIFTVELKKHNDK